MKLKVFSFFIKSLGVKKNQKNQNNQKTNKIKNIKKEKIEFFDSVLKAVGKRSNLFDKNTRLEIDDEPVVTPEPVVANGPRMIKTVNALDMINDMMMNSLKEPATIPDPEDIRKARPDIYAEYVKLATDNTLVIFQPEHLESDKHGFIIHKLVGAYKQIKNDQIILVGDKLNVYNLSEDKKYVIWKFRQEGLETERMKNAQPGTDFSGVRKRKCYRLSDAEVGQLVDGLILLDGGVDIAPTQRGTINDLGGGLFSIGF